MLTLWVNQFCYIFFSCCFSFFHSMDWIKSSITCADAYKTSIWSLLLCFYPLTVFSLQQIQVVFLKCKSGTEDPYYSPILLRMNSKYLHAHSLAQLIFIKPITLSPKWLALYYAILCRFQIKKYLLQEDLPDHPHLMSCNVYFRPPFASPISSYIFLIFSCILSHCTTRMLFP